MICLASFALIPSMSRCSSALISAVSLVLADTRTALAAIIIVTAIVDPIIKVLFIAATPHDVPKNPGRFSKGIKQLTRSFWRQCQIRSFKRPFRNFLNQFRAASGLKVTSPNQQQNLLRRPALEGAPPRT